MTLQIFGILIINLGLILFTLNFNGIEGDLKKKIQDNRDSISENFKHITDDLAKLQADIYRIKIDTYVEDNKKLILEYAKSMKKMSKPTISIEPRSYGSPYTIQVRDTFTNNTLSYSLSDLYAELKKYLEYKEALKCENKRKSTK